MLLAGGICAVRGDEPARQKVPAAARQKEARDLIRDLFRQEFASRDLRQRQALGEKLLKQGQQTEEAASRYVLLDEALQMAVSVGDPPTAFAAIEELSKSFAVDSLKLQSDALTELSRKANTPEAAKYVCTKGLELVNLAVRRDDFNEASRLASLAAAVARRTRDVALAGRVNARKREVLQLQRDFREAEKAFEQLQQDPDDPEAHLALGHYLCFSKGDFEKGIKHLARGSDARLKQLAQQELAAPEKASAQVHLAESWLSAAETEREPLKSHYQGRAAYWYQTALPHLTGLNKTKVELTLKKLRESGVSITASSIAKNAMIGTWTITWDNGKKYNGVRFGDDGKIYLNKTENPWGGTWRIEGQRIIALHPKANERYEIYAFTDQDHFNVQVHEKDGTPVLRGTGERD